MSGATAEAPSNEEVARDLERVAELLDAQHANPFRVRAYRAAASALRERGEAVAHLLEREGVAGLERLPHVGRALAHAIARRVEDGRFPLLDRLEGEARPERTLATVPSLGPRLAARVHEQLGIETLHELEAAAWDGRLARVPGFGERRLRAVRESLAGRLRRRPPPQPAPPAGAAPADEPSVAELLDVDREYRERARAGALPRIAPRRFNPTREAWLPVLHTTRDDRHYTALYSNTARAHELGATDDWVVVYRDDRDHDGRWTIITAHYGPIAGRRIVRGREAECERLPDARTTSAVRATPRRGGQPRRITPQAMRGPASPAGSET